MTGAKLYVIGVGPGGERDITGAALAAIDSCSDFFGYAPYLDRLQLRADQVRHASDNREEMSRAQAALTMAVQGARVGVVSGGDAGVFGMAAAICEAIETGPSQWRNLHVEVIPGVTAMLAVAARTGAPLGHDFCAISLSDNLKPWDVIALRLRAAATAGFVIALYNPVSKARPWQLTEAFRILGECLPASTPVIFGRAAGRSDERLSTVHLGAAHSGMADMATCVIVGSSQTRVIARDAMAPLVYSPRSLSGFDRP